MRNARRVRLASRRAGIALEKPSTGTWPRQSYRTSLVVKLLIKQTQIARCSVLWSDASFTEPFVPLFITPL